MHKLREYQQRAVSATYLHLQDHDTNPCCVLPTGAGKSHLIAQFCEDAIGWNSRVLVVAHVRELLEQSLEKIRVAAPEIASEVGLYSAGLGSRDTEQAIIVAGVQSIYKRAEELGHRDVVIVDEVHLIQPDGEGMYNRLIKELKEINPLLRVVGLTATPYRMKSGMICGPGRIMNQICHETGIRELIAQGFLSPLISRKGTVDVDRSTLRVRAGEFVSEQLDAVMCEDTLVSAACSDLVRLAKDRHSVLVFASGVNHGKVIADKLVNDHGESAETIFGETPSDERAEVLRRFRSGDLKFCVNMNVLTVGFDGPNIDCIAMVRPTKSPGLYYQSVGRGFRIDPSKNDCLVLDFAGNISEHGPIDELRIEKKGKGTGEAPVKECPDCFALVSAGFSVCPHCGFVFPARELKHKDHADEEDILAQEQKRTEYAVLRVGYFLHTKKGAEGDPSVPRTLRVDYRYDDESFIYSATRSEWICLSHKGYAREKAVAWWEARSNAPVPDTAEEGLVLAERGALAETTAIVVRKKANEKWPELVGHTFGEKPPWREPGDDEGVEVAPVPPKEDWWQHEDIPF